MNYAIRSFGLRIPSVFLNPLSYCVAQKASSFKLRQVTTLAQKPANTQQNMETSEKMDPNNPQHETEDVISHSFGEAYATRCEEEGFGGIYRGNQSFNQGEDNEVNENQPAYDKSQGSEVKEKEKARHQTNASN